jgi:hypothetical protein
MYTYTRLERVDLSLRILPVPVDRKGGGLRDKYAESIMQRPRFL